MRNAISFILASLVVLVGCDASAGLTTRQMQTTGTPTTIPATASNGSSDSVARVDHTHNCATATSTQPGCLSAADWITFAAKENVLTFGDGTSRTGDAVSCVDASGTAKGCVTTAAQSFAGSKTFTATVITRYIDGNDSLRIRSTGTSGMTLESASGVVDFSKVTTTLRHADTSAHTFTISVDSGAVGRNVLAIDNGSGSEEPNYATDLDIAQGRLKVCSVDRINCDGSASFTSIAAGSWGSHGHTDASSGGTLSASAIASGTLAAARGGTGLSTPTSDSVMVGNGSAWEAKVLTDCDATGSVMQFDTTTNAFSCATRSSWTTVSSFSNSWAACTAAPRYRKTADGQVHLSGCIKSGSSDATAFTLGTGYQPASGRGFAVGSGVGSPTTCLLNIGTDGAVQPRSGCDNNAVYLDGISFFTD